VYRAMWKEMPWADR